MARLPLDAAYRMQVTATRERTQHFALAQFAKSQHRNVDMARFLKAVVPVVLAGRRQVSALTDSYLAQTLSKQLDRPVAPRGPIDTDALRGVPADVVYQRPYATVWTKLSQGVDYAAATRAGVERLTDVLLTDMQMAKTFTAQDVLSNTKGVTGFAREVSGSNTCALCLIASTQVYSREDLLPIHPGCDCDVVPISADAPWDKAAAQQRLADTHAAVFDRLGISDAGGRNVGLGTGRDYTKLLVTHNHGEIGSLLSVKGQTFTGPTQLAKAVPVERLTMLDAQIAGYEETLAAGGGTDWMRQQMPRLYAERASLTT